MTIHLAHDKEDFARTFGLEYYGLVWHFRAGQNRRAADRRFRQLGPVRTASLSLQAVSEAEFGGIFGRVKAEGIAYLRAAPRLLAQRP